MFSSFLVRTLSINATIHHEYMMKGNRRWYVRTKTEITSTYSEFSSTIWKGHNNRIRFQTKDDFMMEPDRIWFIKYKSRNCNSSVLIPPIIEVMLYVYKWSNKVPSISKLSTCEHISGRPCISLSKRIGQTQLFLCVRFASPPPQEVCNLSSQLCRYPFIHLSQE